MGVQGRERRRERIHKQTPAECESPVGSIPGPWQLDLSQSQELATWATVPSRHPHRPLMLNSNWEFPDWYKYTDGLHSNSKSKCAQIQIQIE